MEGIEICGREADRLSTKGFGRRRGKCVQLSYEEALYLAERGNIRYDFWSVFERASRSRDFDVRFFVYRDLRSRGYIVRVAEDHFDARKSYNLPFYPLSDLDSICFESFLSREMPLALAVVDGDGDVTYYMLREEEPRGTVREEVEIGEAVPAGNRVFLKDFENLGTFGKREGEFAHLSLFEARYLLDDLEIGVNPLLMAVYEDLRGRGLIVKSGFKYGTHFRAYENSLGEHSKYLVHVPGECEDMQRISRAVRVAHGVRKNLLLARPVGGKVRYLSLAWIRP